MILILGPGGIEPPAITIAPPSGDPFFFFINMNYIFRPFWTLFVLLVSATSWTIGMCDVGFVWSTFRGEIHCHFLIYLIHCLPPRGTCFWVLIGRFDEWNISSSMRLADVCFLRSSITSAFALLRYPITIACADAFPCVNPASSEVQCLYCK